MAKTFSGVLGIVLLVIGIIGWLTGGHDHVLIIFGINMLHNIVHIVSGLFALLAALAGTKYAKIYCVVFGIIYGMVTIGGFLNLPGAVLLLNLNLADNILHLVISAACLWIGIAQKT